MNESEPIPNQDPIAPTAGGEANPSVDAGAMALPGAPMAGVPEPPTLTAEELAAIAAAAPVPTAEELAGLAAATAVAIPLSGHVQPDGSDASVATADAGKATTGRNHRIRIRGWIVRFATFVFTLALLAAGAAMGVAAFQRVQPPAPLVGDPSTGGVAAPPVVRELTEALASNNADSLRSAVSGDPYRLLTGELQSWSLHGVTSVQTLATMQDGPRSATEIIITGRSATGDPRVFNLVVHVSDNQIVNFR